MSKVLLGDVARERRETCKGSKDGYPIVGLEHLTPEEITLSAWDEDKENTFTKLFRKGDVLFGRRRAYLKKAAVAPFDGICSGDITVIEAIPEKILPELLPFIIQNDALFDFAVGKSAGSLSPRVKWEHLRNYSFELPNLEEQRRLAKVLWAMDATKKAYQKLIQKTDELVISQFIALFGEPITNSKGLPLVKLGELGIWKSGGTPSRSNPAYYTGRINWYSAGELNSMYLSGSVEKITESAVSESSTKIFKKGSMLVGMYDTAALKMGILVEDSAANQACANIEPYNNINLVWLYHTLQIMKDYFLAQRHGCRQKNLSVSMLKNFEIPYAPIGQQEQFVAFSHQRDKSKFELEQALAELTATYKRIIAENLG